MSIDLPRYVVVPKGRASFYWQVPAKRRVVKDGKPWPKGVVRLPDDAGKMLAEAAKLNRELDEIRAGVDAAARKGTMPWLIEKYEHSPYFTELRARSKRSYQEMARHVLRWSKERGHPPFAQLTTPKVLEFLAQYDDRRSLRDHVSIYLKIVLEYACRIGEATNNPARHLGLKKARRKKPIRIVDVPQLLAIVAKAREMDLHHIAIGALLQFDLGQRQGDTIRLQKPRDYKDGQFQFKQSKTGQVVTILPFLSETREALAALPATQMSLVAGRSGLAVNEHTYRDDFRRVADAAGFHDLWSMELRHSAVIYMERAGLHPAEIATRTGHTLGNVMHMLESYRFRDNIVAHNGMVKLEEYRNKLGTKV